MITLYHLETSHSERVVWLMEELGLPYEPEIFPRRPDAFAPDAFNAIHRPGRAPIIRDGETLLAESGAIVECITARLSRAHRVAAGLCGGDATGGAATLEMKGAGPHTGSTDLMGSASHVIRDFARLVHHGLLDRIRS